MQGRSHRYGWSGFNLTTLGKKNLAATYTARAADHPTFFAVIDRVLRWLRIYSLKLSLPSELLVSRNLYCAPRRASGLIASWPFLHYDEQEAPSVCDMSL